jgi:hypothetical protein
MEEEKPKYLMLKFSGNKEELHKQLKEWCDISDRTMNGTIIELVQILIKVGSMERLKKIK